MLYLLCPSVYTGTMNITANLPPIPMVIRKIDNWLLQLSVFITAIGMCVKFSCRFHKQRLGTRNLYYYKFMLSVSVPIQTNTKIFGVFLLWFYKESIVVVVDLMLRWVNLKKISTKQQPTFFSLSLSLFKKKSFHKDEFEKNNSAVCREE
jgi:hypothetical protein